MIKDIFNLFSYISRLLLKGMIYLVKGIGWYISGIDQALRSYPKKGSSKVKVKGEIL